ncbi:MAG TPA: hypothetical protein VHA56_16240 [Mucilaginibacter sp.]|nr:hypothetical protein [Mucilaginibacter sp.]
MDENTEITSEVMRMYADLLKTIVPPGYGFTLMVFKFDDPLAYLHYISSARRQEMVAALEVQLDKFKRGDNNLDEHDRR